MKPSGSMLSSTLARIFEPGVVSLPLRRICALRIRVSISPNGSFTDMIRPSPARLDQTRDEALRPQFPQRDARHLHLAIIAARTAGDFATVANAHGRGVARQFRQFEARLEA